MPTLECSGFKDCLTCNLHTYTGFGNSGELARSATMTTAGDNGEYDIGKTFLCKEVTKFDKGKSYVDTVPDPEVANSHFLKPQHVTWASNPKLKRTVIAVGVGFFHILVAARDPGDFQSKLYTSGLNNHGQLGHGDADTNGRLNRHALTLVRFSTTFSLLVFVKSR